MYLVNFEITACIKQAFTSAQCSTSLQSQRSIPFQNFKKTISERIDVDQSTLDLVYPYFAERKNARIEMQCTIVEKKLWQHKAIQAKTSVSKLISHTLKDLKVIVPRVEELNQVVNERV
ncbi:hypothetical protein ACXJY6_10895 [Vibrio sp. RC27]